MSFIKKIWTSRQSEYPNRRQLTLVTGEWSGSGAKLVNVSRDEGNISQPGDGFTKANMDDLENRIGNAFTAEHTFLQATLGKNATYADFSNAAIVAGIIPHIYVPMEYCKLVPDSYTLNAEQHTLRVSFKAGSTSSLPDAGIILKLKIEKDETPQV